MNRIFNSFHISYTKRNWIMAIVDSTQRRWWTKRSRTKMSFKFFQKTLKEQNFIDASTFREPRLLIKKIFSSTNIPSTFRGCKKKICCKWNSEVNWMKYDYNEKVFAFCYTEYLVRTTRSKRLNIDLINLLNWLRCELLS